MKQTISEFLNALGNELYRNLIGGLIQKHSTTQLQHQVLGEVSLLPKELQGYVMDYIDVTNNRIAYNANFWQASSCEQAFVIVMETALNFLPIKDRIPTLRAAYEPENQELAYNLFMIPTMSIAYSASMNKAQRKLMGIRKGFFG